jgi:ankyrin repeat protein
MAHKNRRDRTPNKLKRLHIDSTESDYSDSPESRSSEDTSTSTSASSSSEGSGDEESLDLSSSEDTSEQYQKLRAEYQKMCDKYDDLRTQFSDLVKSSTSARKLDRKSSRKRRGRSTKTSRATRASELSSSPTNFPRAYSAIKAPKKSEFMIDPNMPLSERMARRHVSHLSSDFIALKTKSEEINLQKSRESPRPKSSQLSHSSASTTSNPLFQSDILSNCFINELDERGVTPLIHAIEFGDTELLQDLIDNQGADINVPNSEGEAPLLIAMKKRRPDIAMLLLERHADVNVTVPLLLNTPLHLCFLEDIFRPEFVDQLMHHQELEVDAQNNLGNTPLFLAVYAKEVQYVTMLLQRGANVHLRNKHGVTPLLTACEIGALECAEQLLTFGADVNAVDNHGESGLHKAAKHGYERVVEMLLQRKINPRIENNLRSRAIDLPATHRIKKLLEGKQSSIFRNSAWSFSRSR